MNEIAGKIQDSELEVMRVLWEAGEALPLIEIRRVLSARCRWEDSTIKPCCAGCSQRALSG